MADLRAAAQLAVTMLQTGMPEYDASDVLEVLQEALAEPVQAEPVAWTARELELIDGMIEVQRDHAQRCDSIANRTMAEKQKGWDLERVAVLQKIRGTAPQPQRTWVGLTPEPDDEGLYSETQVQQLRESFEQSVTDPENQPSQYGTVPMDWYDRDTALLRQALEALERGRPQIIGVLVQQDQDAAIAALKERLA